ncbi:WD40-repeat-containing domain protein, partial [Mycena maculata]
MKNFQSQNFAMRSLNFTKDSERLKGQIQTVTWAIESFTVDTMLQMEFRLDEHINFSRDNARVIVWKLDGIESKVDAIHRELKAGDGHPPHALEAPFNSKERECCLESTRATILTEIVQWIETGSSGQSQQMIFWLNGAAGTGKTTIAYTIAQECKNRGILGASFFCSRDDADCSNLRLIFTTIAYQLGLFKSVFGTEVSKVLKATPDIGYTNAQTQLEELIVKPLHMVRDSFTHCVIILDALDECKDTATTSIILSVLARHIEDLSPLIFLVTSRPENHIKMAFTEYLQPNTQELILHQVKLDLVEQDIRHYLCLKLEETRRQYQIGQLWPTASSIDDLAKLSSGLFIFAATSVKYIADRSYFNPRGQLESLVGPEAMSFEGLDGFYTQILALAFPTISPIPLGLLKMVLGSIIHLQDPLSSIAVENLLGLPAGRVREILLHLHAVLIVPDNVNHVIRLLHPSFADFITNPDRCLISKYVVKFKEQHTLLARSCLMAMEGLSRDICQIQDPTIPNNEVEDLSLHIGKYIPIHIQYACRHWAYHLTNSMLSTSLLQLLQNFCEQHLLHWIEVCSLMGELRNVILSVADVHRILAGKSATRSTIELLHDCGRFTRAFFPIISTYALQTYHSALLFTPEDTRIRSIYREDIDLPAKIFHAVGKTWDPCMQILFGHSDGVQSVVFSPDGMHIASGSWDNTVKLWDAASGSHLQTFKGHSDGVNSVAFSPNGVLIASGCRDTTVRLWDVASGSHLQTFKGHSDTVRSVAFSPDGAHIASGSCDNTVRLWDAASGSHLHTFKGHSDSVHSVAFSPDGAHIASGSDDKTIQLWDAASGSHLQTFKRHSDWVLSVAFSPDGAHIASGSYDKTIRLWDAASGSHLGTFRGHSDDVNSVAFSPDGALIASGSNDNTTRLWDAASGTHLHTFKGHSDSVHSVAFSPDGAHIASGSDDKTIQLWDAASGSHLQTFKGHSDWVLSVAFSPDGMHIASGSRGSTIQLWDAASGSHLHTLNGHSEWVSSVTFSPDSAQIASGSHDQTIRLWDVASGSHLQTFKGHSDTVRSVAFSPDGALIASGSWDNTVRLWDVASGSHLQTFKGHSDWVRSVAFSPDGVHIASGSDDKTIRLWDAASGSHLRTLEGHCDWVLSVVFSLDSAHIISGADNKTFLLWDASTGSLLDTSNHLG